jgi:transcriptional regulator GlxA family with amidase domain
MNRRLLLRGGAGVAALAALGGAGWIVSLPAATRGDAAPPVPRQEVDAILAMLKPKRPRPLIAIIGVNEGTEITDYMMPFGILRRADVADVVAVATKEGPVTLFQALKVEAQASVAALDAAHPEGADYVIVPAMHRDDDPAALAWIKAQAGKGATIIGICAGAKVVAAAGLLDGKRATTHWYYLKGMRGKHPTIRYVPDRRIVADRGVVTTTGITASMPMALTLIEAIAGRSRAEAVAQDIGLPQWDTRHDSSAFRLTRSFALTVMRNRLAFWNHEDLGIALESGVDEVSLALVADAWSRTYRSQALTFAPTGEARESRNGLRILPDRVAPAWPAARLLPPIADAPAEALDKTLEAIASRYDASTANIVAMQLEYPRTTSA